jgi:hypothetical protein
MYIDVSESELDHLQDGHYDVHTLQECKLGDEVVFRVNKRPVARAIVDRIEKFEGYRFYWQPHTFEKLDNADGFSAGRPGAD